MYIFQRQQVGVTEDRDNLVLQGGADYPALAVSKPLLLVLSYEALLLPSQRPCWDGWCYSWVGRADEGAVGDGSILLRQKYDPEVAVMTSTEVTLDRCRVYHQELVDILDVDIVRKVHLLGE